MGAQLSLAGCDQARISLVASDYALLSLVIQINVASGSETSCLRLMKI